MLKYKKMRKGVSLMEELQFKNGKFRIMILTDIHMRAADNSDEDRAKRIDYYNLHNNAIEKLKPDLAVFLGDNFSADSLSDLQELADELLAPYRNYCVPVAAVLGNHDLELKVKEASAHIDAFNRYEKSLFCKCEHTSDYNDYYLNIKSSDGKRDALRLWLFYSGNRAADQSISRYAYVEPKQIEWYEKTEKLLREQNNNTTVPAIALQHIPVPEVYRLLKKRSRLSALTDGIGCQLLDGKEYYSVDRKLATGHLGEAPGCPDYNSGQFRSWVKTGDIFAAFFGHDHMNDFAGEVDGIGLYHCKTAGFHSYCDGMRQAVRIIDIDEACPEAIVSRMVSYSELVGESCLSVTGLKKKYPDKLTIKRDIATKALPAAAVMAAAAIIIKKIKKE